MPGSGESAGSAGNTEVMGSGGGKFHGRLGGHGGGGDRGDGREGRQRGRKQSGGDNIELLNHMDIA